MNGPTQIHTPISELSWREQIPIVVLTAALWGEIRSGKLEEIAAVGCAIRNRRNSGRWGDTWKDVLLFPKQFSCFNPGNVNEAKMRDPNHSEGPLGRLAWRRCQAIAQVIMDDVLPDNTGGATHYLTPEAAERVHWDDRMMVTRIIGGHIFLREAT